MGQVSRKFVSLQKIARVAQWIRHPAPNWKIAGSNPAVGIFRFAWGTFLSIECSRSTFERFFLPQWSMVSYCILLVQAGSRLIIELSSFPIEALLG